MTPVARARSRRSIGAVCCLGLFLVAGCGTGVRSGWPGAPPAGSPSRTRRAGKRQEVVGSRVGPALSPAPSWAPARSNARSEIEGFADRVSVLPGSRLHLFVSTVARTVTVTAFRMGWYGGAQAAQIARWGPLPGRRQPVAAVVPATRTRYAPWRPTLTVDTTGWPPGDYLFRLDASGLGQSLVPLTIRSPSTAGRVVILNAVTTWQAYNTWGGASLYRGPDGRLRDRSYAVSFDRPYAFGDGSADFLGNELPLVSLAERLHLPLAYATDVDLHEGAHLLDRARALVSLGHDEYWSAAMRAHATAGRDHGVNVAFLGANAIFRPIRLAPSSLGPNRLEISYKNARLDPMFATDPAAATAWSWESPPDPRPPSVLTGTSYQCNPVHADLVAVDSSSWLLKGLVRDGQHLRGLVGSEFDRVDPHRPTPQPIEVLFHSPVVCGGTATYADAAYYTAASGAGVFDSGTSTFVCALQPGGCADAAASHALTGIVTRLLTAFAAGPAGKAHPARDNLSLLRIGRPPTPTMHIG